MGGGIADGQRSFHAGGSAYRQRDGAAGGGQGGRHAARALRRKQPPCDRGAASGPDWGNRQGTERVSAGALLPDDVRTAGGGTYPWRCEPSVPGRGENERILDHPPPRLRVVRLRDVDAAACQRELPLDPARDSPKDGTKLIGGGDFFVELHGLHLSTPLETTSFQAFFWLLPFMARPLLTWRSGTPKNMRLTFVASAVLVATGTLTAAAWLRQDTLATPEPLTVALWGLALIGLSGGLRSALRRPRQAPQRSLGRASPQNLESAKQSATQAA